MPRYGVPIDCRDHGESLVVEGQCNSGAHEDCHGSVNLVSCCSGHLQGQVHPTILDMTSRYISTVYRTWCHPRYNM